MKTSQAYKLSLIALLLQLLFMRESLATYLYVDPLGKNTNDCLSPATACKSIQSAANKTRPGDVVLINAGAYYGGFIIPRSGTATAPITYMAVPGTKPVIHLSAKDWWGIAVPPGSSYLTISGLTIVGSARQVTQTQAEEWARNSVLLPANGQSCIAIGGDNTLPTTHHIIVAQNTVRFCPGAGIYAVHADYITVVGNSSSYNGWWNWNGPSGISIYESVDIDANTGFKNFIMNNSTFMNAQKVPHPQYGFTDGNGIIIDKNENTDGTRILYAGKTYIANNLSYWNGAAGISSYFSRNVSIINNTCFQNSRNLPRGEIYLGESSQGTVRNNILFATNFRPLVVNENSAQIEWDRNLLFGGNRTDIRGPNDRRASPLFYAPANQDFRIRRDSLARGLGSKDLAPEQDIAGTARGDRIDAGAYQAP